MIDNKKLIKLKISRQEYDRRQRIKRNGNINVINATMYIKRILFNILEL